MYKIENMVRKFELRDTDKTIKIKVVTPLRDGYNDEMLYAYTDYLMDELKHYQEYHMDINTLDDILLILGEMGKEEKENRLTFNFNVWEVKEEFYNYFSEYNFIVHYDEDTYFKEVDIENYEHLGLVTAQCEFSIEDY